VAVFVFALGLKKIPAGWPGGLEIRSPEEGVDPNWTAPAPRCTASSEEKYSFPFEVVCDIPRGEGGGKPVVARSSIISFVPERLERSELLRALGGRGERLDGCIYELGPKNDELDAGVAGLVAMGEKKGSTGGRVTAICSCVSTL
jgi:hypothetical protein